MGNTGRSVSRSYQTVLDLLVPVEASLAGLITSDATPVPSTGQRKIIKYRYDEAMRYLKGQDDAEAANANVAPSSRLKKYVEKQEAWTKAVERYAAVQKDQQGKHSGSIVMHS